MIRIRSAVTALALARLVALAWIALASFDVTRAVGFARIHERVRTFRIRQRGTHLSSIDQIVWAVDEACVWYVKRAACFHRSVVATWLLRRYGHAASLVIAYRPIPFESHAWVEVDGRVVNDLSQYQKAFAVLDRL